MTAMADVLGPIFTLWVGGQRTVVISSSDLAKECFTTNDKNLLDRIDSAVTKYMSYNYAVFGFGAYGDYWMEARKLVSHELLSPRRIERLKHVRAAEIDLCVKEVHRKWVANNGEPAIVDLSKLISDLVFNNVVMTMAGKRFYYGANMGDEKEVKEFREATDKFFDLAGLFVVSDGIPWLEWADIGGYIKDMKNTMKICDIFVSNWLEEHKLKRKRVQNYSPTNDEDSIDIMLSKMGDYNLVAHPPDTVVKAIFMGLLLGAVDTSAHTLVWALSLLMNNKHALKKAQAELDSQVGKNRTLKESDIKNLDYLQAVVKETMRLYPPAPLGLPHKSIKDCKIGAYHVPAKTQIVANIWKIQRDPAVWPNPDEFCPERFLLGSVKVDVRGQHFGLIPFGAGRRICPGITYALQFIHITLARLLHSFEFDSPAGAVDMSAVMGLTLAKETPLQLICAPRLLPEFYASDD